jgi:acetyl-CoA carboxylase biotin carboxyl carrier protein
VVTDNGASSTRPPDSNMADMGGPEGVAKLVRSLAEIMRDGEVEKLDLAVGSLSIRMRGGKKYRVRSDHVDVEVSGAGAKPAPSDPEHIITAPMIGTYYSAPSPGARPFVDVGDVIKAGQVIGIIEAMKIMNEILADESGEVTAILATNGQPVEYGSPLILLSPSTAP